MNRQETLSMLCGLASHVGHVKFKDEITHDCFCLGDTKGFDMHPEVIAFIMNATYEKLQREVHDAEAQKNDRD